MITHRKVEHLDSAARRENRSL